LDIGYVLHYFDCTQVFTLGVFDCEESDVEHSPVRRYPEFSHTLFCRLEGLDYLVYCIEAFFWVTVLYFHTDHAFGAYENHFGWVVEVADGFGVVDEGDFYG
jgi:hypothetical protein